MAVNTVPITAAICTRNRPAQLARALQSLCAQHPAPAEIVVVDNAPSSSAAHEMLQRQFPRVRYVRERVAGLDFARNRALRESVQPVVAFLDDDAVAAAGWAEGIAHTFQDPRVGACTGRVEALSLESEGQRLFEENGGFARGRSRVRLPHDATDRLRGRRAPLVAWAFSVGSGASLAVRRDVALAIGGFDEALDMGAALPGGGDHDMLWRVLQRGFDVVYEPAVLARHEHRHELEAAYAQIVGHQRALIALLTKMAVRTGGRARVPVLAFLVWRLTKPAVRLIRRAAGRDPLPAPVLLRMWWHCLAGLTAYPRARRLAERRRLGAAA